MHDIACITGQFADIRPRRLRTFDQAHCVYSARARYMLSPVSPSVTRVDQSKRLKLGLSNFHHTVPRALSL